MNNSISSSSCNSSSCVPSDSCQNEVCEGSRNSNCVVIIGDTIIQSIDEKDTQPLQQQYSNEDKKGRRPQSNAENENSIAAESKKMIGIGTAGQLKPAKAATGMTMLNLSSQSKETTQALAEQGKSLDLVDQDQLQLCQRQLLPQSKLQSALQERSLNKSVSSCQAVSEKGSFIGDQQGRECRVEGSENLLSSSVGFTESKESCQMEKQLNGQIFQEVLDDNLSIHSADDDIAATGKIVDTVADATTQKLSIVPVEAEKEEEETSNKHTDLAGNNGDHTQNEVGCVNCDTQSPLDQLGEAKLETGDGVEITPQLLGEQKDGEINAPLNQTSSVEFEDAASHSATESTTIHSTSLGLQPEFEEPKAFETVYINAKDEEHLLINLAITDAVQQHSMQDPSESVDQSVGMQNPSHLSSAILCNSEETAIDTLEQQEVQEISHETNFKEERNLPSIITIIEEKETQQDNKNNVSEKPTSSEQEKASNSTTALTSSNEVNQKLQKTYHNNGSDKTTQNLIEQNDSIIQEKSADAGRSSKSVERDEQAELDWQFIDGMDELIDEISGQLRNEGYVLSSSATARNDSGNVVITSSEENFIKKILKDVANEGQEQIQGNYSHDMQEREASTSMEYLLECVKIISEAEKDLDSLQKCMLKEQQTLQEIQALAMKQIGSKTKEQLENEKQKRFQEQQEPGNYREEERQQVSSGIQKVKNNTQQKQQQQQSQPQNGNVRDILAVSLENIRFGVVFPGNIFEDAVEISNKSNDTIFLKAVGLCLNPEFDSHGEYVYSIRKTTNYDYNEKLTVQVSPQSTVKIHVALKVPNIHAATILKGSFAVTISGYDTYISIPITAQVEIPKIVCTRQLFHSSSEHKIIRLAIRKSKKNDCKIPFKNVSNHQVQIEPTWLDDQQMVQLIASSSGLVSKVKQPSPFNLILQPALFTVPPKGFFMMQCILKPSSAYKEFAEKRAQENDKSALLIKNVLLLKIVNSSIILHFPLSLEIAL